MNSNFYAVIMGFNKFADHDHLPQLQFAEKDASDLSDVLTDKNYGNVPTDNVSLLIGNVSREEIETELYTKAVLQRGPENTVLIYYSGHGFIAGDIPESYLATPDTNIREIVENPNAGLPMEYLRDKIFRARTAKSVRNMILVLDICLCGSFSRGLNSVDVSRTKSLVELHDFDADGRVAFVASPHSVASKEDRFLKNGVFTHFLVKGLRGEATEPATGEVTIGSLVAFVQSRSPWKITPVFYGKSLRIVLTRPKVTSIPGTDIKSYDTRIDNASEEIPNPEQIHIPSYNPIANKSNRNLRQSIETKPPNLLKVFLCHSSYDKPAVRNLYVRLRAERGIDPWLDEQKLLPGVDWDLEIRTAIKSSHVVVVCLSKSSINKEGYVQKEIVQALDVAEEKPAGILFIIPLRFEECKVPLRLQRWHWLNYYEDNSYERLLSSLKKRARDLEIDLE